MRLISSNKILLLTVTLFHFIFGTSLHAGSDSPAISLNNTDFVVLIAFLAFLAILIYLKVPSKIAGMLDDRSNAIEEEINNANLILEESKTMLAELEREHKLNIEKAKKTCHRGRI